MTSHQDYFNSEEFSKIVSALSRKAGFVGSFTVGPLMGGRNNKVFSVTYNDRKRLLLKAYFQHPHDPRNRLSAEYSFLSFIRSNNIKCVPKPYAADFKNNLALYEFIEGRKLLPSEINKGKVKAALDFFIEINKYKQLEGAKKLPIASEAYFSIKEHINIVKRRISGLKKIKGNSEVNNKALSFVKRDLSQTWQRAMSHLEGFIRKYGINPERDITSGDKCISPSDFGFHNTLLDDSGRIYFIDFEYAGIDDPAKMVCDFFCQPEVPVPSKYFDFFVDAIANHTLEPKKCRQRINALLPIYKIKWCCILLNDFLEVGFKRRNFAYGDDSPDKQKINQLEKAREYLGSIKFEKASANACK